MKTDSNSKSSKQVAEPLLDAVVIATSLSCASVCLFGFGSFSHVELFVASAGLILAIAAKVAAPFVQRRRRASLSTLGPYTLGPKIGQGGMGEVYRARHSLMDRDVAIKILPSEHADEEGCLRFEREVQLTSRLESPNTVSIHDYGRTPDGGVYYVMELIDGYDLDRLITKFGPVSPGRAVHLVKQICTALEEAHAIGLVHRDIKPANIALCERAGVFDVVKVLDFGLVEELGNPSSSRSSGSAGSCSSLIGTPAYLAPESILNPDAIDARTDLYSVGAVAYWLLTGKTVFDGNSVVEICSHHIHTPPELPSIRLGRDVPSDLEAVILRCLAKDPTKRYASTRLLREALDRCECAADWSSNAAEEWWRGSTSSSSSSSTSSSTTRTPPMLWQARVLASMPAYAQ